MKESFEKAPNEQDQIVRELKDRILTAYSGTERMAMYEKMAEFGEHLLKNYPDCKEHLLFHVLIGSTPYKAITLFDFPGDDSVEKFIREQM